MLQIFSQKLLMLAGSGPRCQDTILGDVDVQTRFETTSIQSNDPPLSKVNTFGSREDKRENVRIYIGDGNVCWIKIGVNTVWHQLNTASINHIYYAFTECPTLSISLIEQFWQTAALSTTEDGVHAITATIDGRDKNITEASIRIHLKLQDSEGGHTPGSDEGRLKHDELMELVTKLSDRVVAIEDDLKQTKKTYSTTLTKLVLKVKKLEKHVMSGKVRRRDPTISLVQDEGTSWFQEDVETQEKNSADTEVLLEEETLTKLIKDLRSGEKGEKEISTADVPVSTAAAALVYIRRSASKAKDKGKAIM
ncbi:hypothetical protein Tco_0626742 [Tanacetum coccineum]|uniref:Uncharacterized protein n=1 Tax=Tanacetum coccineum TaxID=301880 RepID=A0ABQ4WKE7_9ASTR